MGEFRTKQGVLGANPSAIELELLEKAEAGELLDLGELPAVGDTSRTIRAGIIRYLLMGGCEDLRCHEKGVQVRGALIPDKLDIEGCDSDRSLTLFRCRFERPLVLMNAQLRGVFLDGAHCPGIFASGLNLRESMHLCGGFRSTGEVQLLRAAIGGNLVCNDGTFQNGGGYALSADGAAIDGDVFMQRRFHAFGEVRLLGAQIGGDLACDQARFQRGNGHALSADGLKVSGSVYLRNQFRSNGVVQFSGAEIGGALSIESASLQNMGGYALYIGNAKIVGPLVWRGGNNASGKVLLAGAICAELNDEFTDWPEAAGSLSLNQFTYGSIGGHGAVDAETRLKWLALNDVSRGFRPQPYQHLAKVLREMGHAEDARKVMVEKEKLQRADRLVRLEKRLGALQPTDRMPDDQYVAQTTHVNRHQLKFDLWWLPKWDRLFRRLVGYGYYPFNSFWFGLGLFLFAAALFSMTWHSGAFAPNSPVILISEEWASVLSEDNPAKAWEVGPGRDYETYNSFAYAFDAVIPLIDLGQESAWSPSTSRGPFGWFAWWAKWILKIAGWIITALGAAALTGIIRRD